MAWAPAYLTTAVLRSYLHIDDTDDDVEIDAAIEAASRAVDLDCGRQFGSVTAEQRFYTGRYDRGRARWVVEIDDLMSVAGFAAIVLDNDNNTLGTITAYVLEPRNAAVKGKPWTHLMVLPTSVQQPTGRQDAVAVTAPWGWTAVPDVVETACKIQGARFFNRRTSPYGIAGSPEQGGELRLLARVDPDVSTMLRGVRRWRVSG